MSGGPKKEGRKKSVPNELQREREREEKRFFFLGRTFAPPTFQAFFVPWLFFLKKRGKRSGTFFPCLVVSNTAALPFDVVHLPTGIKEKEEGCQIN